MDEEIVRYLWWLRPMIADEGGADAAVAAAARPRARRSPLILNDPSEEPVPAFAGAARSAGVGQTAAAGSARRQTGSRRASAATMPR